MGKHTDTDMDILERFLGKNTTIYDKAYESLVTFRV